MQRLQPAVFILSVFVAAVLVHGEDVAVHEDLDTTTTPPVIRQKRLVAKWGGGGGGGAAALGMGEDIPHSPAYSAPIPVVGIIRKPVGYAVPVEVPYVPPPIPYSPPAPSYATPP